MTAAARALARRVVADGRTRTVSFAALFLLVTWVNAAGYRSTYPNINDRLRLVQTFGNNKAARMFYGAGRNLTTVGGYTAWRAGGILVVFAALLGIFAATRPMRGDEEAGRTEIVLAGRLTRNTEFAAILAGTGVGLTVAFVATALGAVFASLPLRPSLYLGLVVFSVGAVYVGVAATANQLAPTRRGALGLASAVLGVDFLIRVVADTTDHFGLHWLTPLGWAEETRAFSGSSAFVLVLPLAATAILLAAATMLHARRDLGAAYLPARDSAPPRTRLLVTPATLALRLDRVVVATWTGVILAFALVVGSIAKTVEDIDLPESARNQIAKLGGIDITKASGYIGLTFVIFVFAITVFVCGQRAAAHDEETEHRLETLFALPFGRDPWMRGRALLALAGIASCALAAGIGVWAGAVASRAHLSFVDGMRASVNVLPTAILFLGLGLALFATFPRRAISLLYALVVASFVWELFGALLDVPSWALDLSPFHHVAPVPAKPIDIASALVMLAIGAIAGAIGTVRFRARDLAGD